MTGQELQAMQYVAAGVCCGLGALGGAIGAGQAAGKAVEGMNRQPAVEGEMLRLMLIGGSVATTTGIFALVFAFLAIATNLDNWAEGAAVLGAALSVGVSAIGSGIGSGMVGASAADAVSRQPEHSGRITMNMILAQAMSQNAGIFGLVIGLLLLYWDQPAAMAAAGGMGAERIAEQLPLMGRAIGAGISMGAGAIGPAMGIGFTGAKACEAIAARGEEAGLIQRTMFVGMGVAESTAIYSLVVAIVMIYTAGM
jgi:F-type H+-transporting ATPase subunit c